MDSPHRPDYRVRIGGQQVSAAAGTALLGLHLRMGKRQGAGEAVLQLGAPLPGAVRAGDTVSIELGFGGQRELVFTGTLHEVAPTLGMGAGQQQVQLRAYDALMKLIAAGRRSRRFDNQSAGDVVKAHAADAGVPLGTVQDGQRMAHCYMHQQTPYAHALDLARRNGFDLYATEEGKLSFARFERRAADHTLRRGSDILSARLRLLPALPGVTVVPESPASSAGDDTVTWLVKDPSAHAATEGQADVFVQGDPALRTRDAASAAAKAIVERARTGTVMAEVLLPGRPAIRLGHAVEIKDAPEPLLNGRYEVLAITHSVDRQVGFRTRLELAGMAT